MTKEQFLAIPETIILSGGREDGETYVEINGEYLDLRPSLNIENHSSTGFNWGYSGSGPSQLALAILMEFMPVKEAVSLYQGFKFKVIAGIQENKFSIVLPLRAVIQELLEHKLTI